MGQGKREKNILQHKARLVVLHHIRSPVILEAALGWAWGWGMHACHNTGCPTPVIQRQHNGVRMELPDKKQTQINTKSKNSKECVIQN